MNFHTFRRSKSHDRKETDEDVQPGMMVVDIRSNVQGGKIQRRCIYIISNHQNMIINFDES